MDAVICLRRWLVAIVAILLSALGGGLPVGAAAYDDILGGSAEGAAQSTSTSFDGELVQPSARETGHAAVPGVRLGPAVELLAPQTTRIGDDIVGTSHNTVRPTQDWVYPGTVDDYAARLRAGESIDPIEVQRLADGTEYILDGHHRYVASQLTGIPVPKTVASDVWDVGLDDWADVTYQGPR